ncbi:MAG: DUF1559 domain-containing protein [Planctomycetia bacterium]|nr:DUF1559 domain-containing protein [Planctomycetia bacterium]
MRQVILRPQKSCRAGATWLDVIVFGGLVVVFILGLGVWSMQPSGYHRAPLRSQCKNNLKQWGLALHNYHDTFRCFPPYAGGTSENGERLSGRAMLLPFLEEDPLWQKIARAPGQGGDPLNLTLPAPKLIELEVFLCPSSTVPMMVDGQPHLSYAFNVGDELDFGSGVEDFPNQAKTRGQFGWRHCTRLQDILDGTSNTAFMAERDLGNPSDKRDIIGRVAAVAATSPADCLATASNGQYLAKISVLNELMGERWASGHPFYSVFTTAVRPNGPSCAASTPPSGKSVGGWFTASSRHTGGVHVLMGDGTVRFVNENINIGDPKATQPQANGSSGYGIWGAIGTISGGETVNDF